MIRIEVKGIEGITKALQDLRADKIPTASRNAINDTAFGLQSHLRDLIRTTFKNPHPSTVKNISVVKASKENLAARVRFDQLYRKGVDEYMLPLIEGGGRSMKPSESRLGSFLTPASRVNPGIINKYGNITGGKMMQMLSRLKLMETYAGALQNETARSKARRGGAGKTVEYFMVKPGQKGGLKPGVYQRTQSGVGFGAKTKKGMTAGAFQKGKTVGGISSVVRARGAKPMVLFTKAPSYRPMMPFFQSGTDYVNKTLPKMIAKEIQFYINKGFGI